MEYGKRSKRKMLTVLGTAFLLLVLLGAALMHHFEGWSYGDSLYSTVITVTTVGYGDFVPTTAGGKAIASLVSVVGVVMFFILISIVGDFRFITQS